MSTLTAKLKQIRSALSRLLVARGRTTETIRTLIVVVPLTLLIWIYAERAQVWQDTAQITLTPALNDPTLFPTIADADERVSVSLSGPRVLLDQLKDKLQRQSMDHTLRLNLPASAEHEGDQTADVVQILTSDPLIKGSGVNITQANPPYLHVTVARIVSLEVAVALPPNPPVTLQNVVFDPPRVTLRGPDSSVNERADSVEVDLSSVVSQLTTVAKQPIEVPLTPPRDRDVHVSPASVKMSFEVGATERDGTIQRMPIVVQKLGSLDAKQIVVLKQPLIYNVRIHGPANIVSKLEGSNPALHPSAVLKLGAEATAQTGLQKAVEITDLPPEVKAIGPANVVDYDIRDSTMAEQ